MKLYFSTWAFFLITVVSIAQKITNVRFEQSDKDIVINYDLTGDKGSYWYIEIKSSEDGGKSWSDPLKYVKGDVGTRIKSGSNKSVRWEVLSERNNLEGNICFKVEATNSNSYEIVYIKGGRFSMGCPNESDVLCNQDELPNHSVLLHDYYIGRYEVTQLQWLDVMGYLPGNIDSCDMCPVSNVSWSEVQLFLKKLNRKNNRNFRLPTEAEWEYAARGGNKSMNTSYSGSVNAEEVAWINTNSEDRLHPIGKKRCNELGIYDMNGNVWEWCSDWFGVYPSSPQINPFGAPVGNYRVCRGGSWLDTARSCRISCRFKRPDQGYNYLGFRLAMSVQTIEQ